MRTSTRDGTIFGRLVMGRRATPAFLPTSQVTDEDLHTIVRAGLEAPSSYNLQPWRFVVVKDAQQRRKLRAAARDQEQVEQAPVVIVACGDPHAWREDLERVIEIGRDHGFGERDRIDRKRASVIRDLAAQP